MVRGGCGDAGGGATLPTMEPRPSLSSRRLSDAGAPPVMPVRGTTARVPLPLRQGTPGARSGSLGAAASEAPRLVCHRRRAPRCNRLRTPRCRRLRPRSRCRRLLRAHGRARPRPRCPPPGDRRRRGGGGSDARLRVAGVQVCADSVISDQNREGPLVTVVLRCNRIKR